MCLLYRHAVLGCGTGFPASSCPGDDILQFFTEEEGYLPEGYFSKDAFIAQHGNEVQGVLSGGYDRLWLVGDASVVARKAVDMKTWFAPNRK